MQQHKIFKKDEQKTPNNLIAATVNKLFLLNKMKTNENILLAIKKITELYLKMIFLNKIYPFDCYYDVFTILLILKYYQKNKFITI